MKRRKLLAMGLAVLMALMIFPVISSATFQLGDLNNPSSALTGDYASDIVAVALAQVDRTGSSFGMAYSNAEEWSADFIFSCARAANIPESVIPTTGNVTELYNYLLQHGGVTVTEPKKGDMAFYTNAYCNHVALMTDAENAVHGCYGSDIMNAQEWVYYSTSNVAHVVYTNYYDRYGNSPTITFVRPDYSPHVHVWGTGVVTTPATHTTTGIMTYTCSECGAKKTEPIPTTGVHSFGSWTKLNNTSHIRTCACGETEIADHNWNLGVVTTAATHTVPGVRTYTCINCSATKTEAIPTTGAHTFKNWTKIDDEKHIGYCDCGVSTTESHIWASSTITTPATHTTAGVRTYTCKCGATRTEAILPTGGHSFGDWQKVDDLTHKRVCACGVSETGNHNWDDGIVTKPASHTVEGILTYTCAECGAKKYESIPRTGDHVWSAWTKVDNNTHQRSCACGVTMTENHKWDDGVATTPATHVSEGVMTYTCADCNATMTVSIPKSAEHAYGDWYPLEDDASTTEDESLLHRHECPCGAFEVGTHNWDDGVETTPASHVAEGVMTFTCKECKKERTESIPKNAEHLFAWEKTDDTNHKGTCDCGASMSEPHTWDIVEVTKAATHSEKGERTYTCKCGATKTEEIPTTDEHVYGDEILTEAAHPHKQYRECTVCHHTEYTGTNAATYEGCTICFPLPEEVKMDPEETSVMIGKTVQLTANVGPDEAYDKSVTWTSDDETIATVDVNGLVTGVSAGKATITATSNADGTLDASCEVTVTEVPKFTVSGVSSAAPGSTVSITIRIDQPGVTADLPDAGILGAILEVGYPEGFILKSIERGDALGSMSFLEPEKADDKYPNPGGFLWDAMAPDTSDGILVTLTFDIPADADEGTYAIEISSCTVYDKDGNEITVEIEDGEIVVTNVVYGDVNCDGKINLLDVVMLRQYIHPSYTVVLKEPRNADTNGDGKINLMDVVRLRQYIHPSYDVQLGPEV